ncbi:UNVERIFIED_CONTAM: SUMO ligase siz1 [Siphonaria sp. JEL0065]|nr:SUMO ligase siz1 [Siphonaria sp. JEL0065]
MSGLAVEYPPLEGAHSNAPNHCAIVMNGSQVAPTLYCGIRGKPWTQKPLELNKFVTKNPSLYNTIDLRFTPMLNQTRELLVVVQFASRVPASEIVETCKRDKLVPKESIIAERRQKTATDDDICLTEEHVSLKDPVTRMRITVPARGNACRHPQCFDLEYYLCLNQTHPTWTCPVCSKLAPMTEVFVDGYFLELLESANFDLNIESAEIALDGTWRLNKEERTGVASDSEDDDYGPPVKKKIKTEIGEAAAPTPIHASSSSAAVIDLTLSDDETPPLAQSRPQPHPSASMPPRLPPSNLYNRPPDTTPSISKSPAPLPPRQTGTQALSTTAAIVSPARIVSSQQLQLPPPRTIPQQSSFSTPSNPFSTTPTATTTTMTTNSLPSFSTISQTPTVLMSDSSFDDSSLAFLAPYRQKSPPVSNSFPQNSNTGSGSNNLISSATSFANFGGNAAAFAHKAPATTTAATPGYSNNNGNGGSNNNGVVMFGGLNPSSFAPSSSPQFQNNVPYEQSAGSGGNSGNPFGNPFTISSNSGFHQRNGVATSTPWNSYTNNSNGNGLMFGRTGLSMVAGSGGVSASSSTDSLPNGTTFDQFQKQNQFQPQQLQQQQQQLQQEQQLPSSGLTGGGYAVIGGNWRGDSSNLLDDDFEF